MGLLVQREIEGAVTRARVMDGPAPVLELPRGRAIRVIVQGDPGASGHLDVTADPLGFGRDDFQVLIRAVDLRDVQRLIRIDWPPAGEIRARLDLQDKDPWLPQNPWGDYAVVHTQANGWAVAVFGDLEEATAALAHFAAHAELWHRVAGTWFPHIPEDQHLTGT